MARPAPVSSSPAPTGSRPDDHYDFLTHMRMVCGLVRLIETGVTDQAYANNDNLVHSDFNQYWSERTSHAYGTNQKSSLLEAYQRDREQLRAEIISAATELGFEVHAKRQQVLDSLSEKYTKDGECTDLARSLALMICLRCGLALPLTVEMESRLQTMDHYEDLVSNGGMLKTRADPDTGSDVRAWIGSGNVSEKWRENLQELAEANGQEISMRHPVNIPVWSGKWLERWQWQPDSPFVKNLVLLAVLAEFGSATENIQRFQCYQRHPILLLLPQFEARKYELADIVRLSDPALRNEKLRLKIAEVINTLTKANEAFRQEFSDPAERDWSKYSGFVRSVATLIAANDPDPDWSREIDIIVADLTFSYVDKASEVIDAFGLVLGALFLLSLIGLITLPALPLTATILVEATFATKAVYRAYHAYQEKVATSEQMLFNEVSPALAVVEGAENFDAELGWCALQLLLAMPTAIRGGDAALSFSRPYLRNLMLAVKLTEAEALSASAAAGKSAFTHDIIYDVRANAPVTRATGEPNALDIRGTGAHWENMGSTASAVIEPAPIRPIAVPAVSASPVAAAVRAATSASQDGQTSARSLSQTERAVPVRPENAPQPSSASVLLGLHPATGEIIPQSGYGPPPAAPVPESGQAALPFKQPDPAQAEQLNELLNPVDDRQWLVPYRPNAQERAVATPVTTTAAADNLLPPGKVTIASAVPSVGNLSVEGGPSLASMQSRAEVHTAVLQASKGMHLTRQEYSQLLKAHYQELGIPARQVSLRTLIGYHRSYLNPDLLIRYWLQKGWAIDFNAGKADADGKPLPPDYRYLTAPGAAFVTRSEIHNGHIVDVVVFAKAVHLIESELLSDAARGLCSEDQVIKAVTEIKKRFMSDPENYMPELAGENTRRGAEINIRYRDNMTFFDAVVLMMDNRPATQLPGAPNPGELTLKFMVMVNDTLTEFGLPHSRFADKWIRCLNGE